MTVKKIKNMAMSVKQRLLNIAKQQNEEFQYILERYVLERFLFRLSQSQFCNQFILKGAALFILWLENPHRTTRDIDLLGYGAPDLLHIQDIVSKIGQIKVDDDGLNVDISSIKVSAIREEQIYDGVRCTLNVYLDRAKINLQIDIGFGDSITPEPELIKYPTLLNSNSAPELLAYRKETVVAEKFQAMIDLGMANSRMKDFFDIYFLAGHFYFHGPSLAVAINDTFNRRQTVLPAALPKSITSDFPTSSQKKLQWKSFLTKTNVSKEVSLKEVIEEIDRFLAPLLTTLAQKEPIVLNWEPERKKWINGYWC